MSLQYSSLEETSPTLGPLSVAIHNISTRNLHEISISLPDEKQFLRNWRRQLNDCMHLHSAELFRFLLANKTDLAEAPMIKRCNDLLSKYSKPTWSFTSSVKDLSLNTCMIETNSNLETELGISVQDICKSFKKAVRLYTDTITALCLAENRLEEKLKRIETITTRMNELMFLEPTSALEDIQAPIKKYLASIFDKISLQEDYDEIMKHYKIFMSLRPVILMGNVQHSTTPSCTICMNKEVSYTVTPCGHTYCDECTRSQITSCFICRTPVRDRVRIFFS
jgi:hypothetical protein